MAWIWLRPAEEAQRGFTVIHVCSNSYCFHHFFMVAVVSMGLDWGGACLEQFLWFAFVARPRRAKQPLLRIWRSGCEPKGVIRF